MELIQLIRESISSFLFFIAMGKSYYSASKPIYIAISILLYCGLFLLLSKTYFKGTRLNIYISLATGLLIAFASVRYMPFGGDAQIYCNYIKMDVSGQNIYSATEKYSFNYPPFFVIVLAQFCKYNYESIYPIIYLILISIVSIYFTKEYKIEFIISATLLTSSFLGLRWIFKTGNFLVWEIIFLSLSLFFSKRNANLTLIFLLLFGFQRLWFLLAAIFWYIISKEKINNSSLISSFILLLSLMIVRFDLLTSYIIQLYQGNTLSSVWNGAADHNSPSIFLNFIDVFNLHDRLLPLLLSYSILVIFFISKYLITNIFIQNDHVISQIIFLLIILNPTFKPYLAILATISLFPLFEFMKKDSLNNFIFFYCFLINLFWIVGSIYPMGYPFSIFQIVFLISACIFVNKKSYYILYD